jgi:hypothetical protein
VEPAGDDAGAEVLAFWEEHGALRGETARARLPQLVCLLRDGAGRVQGTSSAAPAEVDALARRRFWVMRRFVAPALAGAAAQLERATLRTLEDRRRGDDDPIGVCLLLSAADASLRPEAQWADPPFTFAGNVPGAQLRVAYFAGASVVPGVAYWDAPVIDLDEGLPVHVFAEQDVVGPEDVVRFWLREGAVDEEEARRRVAEVHLVAIGELGGVAAVTSTFLAHSPELGAELWHYRGFVGAAHRRSALSIRLGVRGREHLAARHASGRDRRGLGVLYEAQTDWVKALPQPHWPQHGVTWVGVNARGDHLRVHWFPGAHAPLPEPDGQGST